MTVPQVTVGFVLAVVVLILALLGVVGVFPAREQTLFALVAALAIARLT